MNYENESGLTVVETGLSAYVDAVPEPHGTNLWCIDLGTNYWNPVYYCQVEGEQGVLSETPSANREWRRIKGDESETSKVIIFWAGANPPQVRYGTAQNPLVLIKNCEDCTFDITGAYAGFGIHVRDSKNIKIRLRGHDFGRGVEVKDSENVVVSDCDLSALGEVGIRYVKSNGTVKRNSIHSGGLSESIAGVYLNNTDNVIAHSNVISDYRYGNYWTWDGCGIYTENGTTNCQIMHNRVYDQFLGFQDNSGSPGNRFIGNTVLDCTHAMDITDAQDVGQADTVFRDNWLSGTSPTGPRTASLPGNKVA